MLEDVLEDEDDAPPEELSADRLLSVKVPMLSVVTFTFTRHGDGAVQTSGRQRENMIPAAFRWCGLRTSWIAFFSLAWQ